MKQVVRHVVYLVFLQVASLDEKLKETTEAYEKIQNDCLIQKEDHEKKVDIPNTSVMTLKWFELRAKLNCASACLENFQWQRSTLNTAAAFYFSCFATIKCIF